MPLPAITPVVTTAPASPVANGNSQVASRNTGEPQGDTAPANGGGFADALKRQMGGHQEDNARHAGADATTAATTAAPSSPADSLATPTLVPPDLATLLSGMLARGQQAANTATPSDARPSDLTVGSSASEDPAVAPQAIPTEGTKRATGLLPRTKLSVEAPASKPSPLDVAAASKKQDAPLLSPPALPDPRTALQLPGVPSTTDAKTKPDTDNARNKAIPVAATDSASLTAAQMAVAHALSAAPAPSASTEPMAISAEGTPAHLPDAFSPSTSGNKAPLSADIAGSGKIAPNMLESPANALPGNKSAATDAPTDNFQAALAASTAQQATEHAHMAATIAQQHAQPASAAVTTPMGAPGWSEDVGNKLVWMAGADLQKADLVLTPPNMGRIEISITVKNEQVTANFVAANSEVRDALEQSLPRLREMFSNAGMSLGQANVSGESSAGQQSGREERSRRYGSVGAVTASSIAAPGPLLRGGNGMVDTFA